MLEIWFWILAFWLTSRMIFNKLLHVNLRHNYDFHFMVEKFTSFISLAITWLLFLIILCLSLEEYSVCSICGCVYTCMPWHYVITYPIPACKPQQTTGKISTVLQNNVYFLLMLYVQHRSTGRICWSLSLQSRLKRYIVNMSQFWWQAGRNMENYVLAYKTCAWPFLLPPNFHWL